MHVGEPQQGAGSLRPGTWHGKRAFEPALSFLEKPTLHPEPDQVDCQLHAPLGEPWRGQGPIERGHDVVVFAVDAAEHRDLVGATECLDAITQLFGEIVEVPLAQGVAAVQLQQALRA
jgi:hypothetical protein